MKLRRAQVELEKSRNRLVELYDFAPLAYLRLDSGGRIVDANHAALALFGVERSVLLHNRLSAFMRPSDADAFHTFRQEIVRGRAKRDCVVTVRGRAGLVPVRLSACVAPGGRGNSQVCHCALVDLSELHSAEDARRTAESQAEALFDSAPDAIVGIDLPGRVVSFNAAAERTFGYRREEVVGGPVEILMPSPYKEEHASHIRRYAATGEAKVIGKPSRVVAGLRKDGSTFPLELNVAEWTGRRERMFTAFLRDVTERENALNGLREIEERFRLITEHVEDALYIVEDNGKLSFVSRAYDRIWGRSSANAEGRARWPHAVHEDDLHEAEASWACTRRGDPFDMEYRIVRDDGSVRWIHDRAFPIEDASGRVIRIIGVAHDLTVERDLELELRQVQKMEVIGTLASGIAHDFNNLLQVIIGCATLASDEEMPVDRARQMMRRAKDVALRGGELVHKLTGFARKEHQKRGSLAIDHVLESITALLRPVLGEHIVLATECAARGALVNAAQVQLEQILLNLASNARDAMPGGGTLTIRSRCSDDGRVHLVVADTGSGMDEATKARVFEPFFTTKGAGKGTGLGLATVQSVTQQLGGQVRVDSMQGRGTAFDIDLPVCEPTSATSPEPLREVHLDCSALLVEDEPIVRKAIRHSLEQLGLHVFEAEDVEDALVLFERHHPDLLVSDVLMPQMTGPKLAEALRARHPELRTLYISGDPRGALDTTSLGPHTRFLSKPFSTEELARELVSLVGASAVRLAGTVPRPLIPEARTEPPLAAKESGLLFRVTIRRRQGNGAVSDFIVQASSPDGLARQLRGSLRVCERDRDSGIWSSADPEVWIGGALIGRLSAGGDIAHLARRTLARLVGDPEGTSSGGEA